MAQATAIRLTGDDLRLDDVWAVAFGAAAALSDEARSKMFVLRPPAPHLPVVLRNDFYPFHVSEHDRPALLARLERLRGEPEEKA